MKFIQDKINDIGQVKWVQYYHDKVKGDDWTNQFGTEIKGFLATPNDCRITYHYFSGNLTAGGRLTESEIALQLKDVVDIVIVPQLEDERRKFASATNVMHNWVITNVAPPVFVLRLSTGHPIEWKMTKTGEEFAPSKIAGLEFLDDKLADRVARALQHAAELCGAGANKEPF